MSIATVDRYVQSRVRQLFRAANESTYIPDLLMSLTNLHQTANNSII